MPLVNDGFCQKILMRGLEICHFSTFGALIFPLLILDELTFLLLNTTCPILANSVDPDQLASEEYHVNIIIYM